MYPLESTKDRDGPLVAEKVTGFQGLLNSAAKWRECTGFAVGWRVTAGFFFYVDAILTWN